MLPVFFYQVPFFRLLLPFLTGIVSGYYLILRSWCGLWICLALFAVLCIQTIRRPSIKSYRWTYGLLLYVFLFAAGISLTWIDRYYPDSETEHGTYVGVIEEPPIEKESSVRTVIRIREDTAHRIHEEIVLAYVRKDSLSLTLRQGDLLLFETTLRSVSNAGNPYEFDYSGYLNRIRIGRSAFVESEQWERLDTYAQGLFINAANKIRSMLLHVYQEAGLTGNELAVASALTLGYRAYLDNDVLNAYAASGAMHVLAVSGLHVGIVYFIMDFLLAGIPFFGKRRKMRAVVLIVLLWFYALITGLPPSVMRSATMFSFIIGVQFFQRKTNTYNSIAASAFLLLVINPFLLFSVSFQLSYLAVLAIVFFHPLIYSKITFHHWLPDKIWGLTCVSIAAQIGTGALALYYFHQFPVYFLATNLLVIPAASVIIYGALLLALLSPFPVLLGWAGWAFDMFIYGLNSCIFFIEKLPGSLLHHVRFQGWELVLYYLLIVSLIAWLLAKRKPFLFISLFLCLCWIVGATLRTGKDYSRQQIIVYRSDGNSLFQFINGRDHTIWYRSRKESFNPASFISDQQTAMRLRAPDIRPLDMSVANTVPDSCSELFSRNGFGQFAGKRFAVFTPAFPSPDTSYVIPVDVAILSQNPNIKIEQVVSICAPGMIVIDSSNSAYRAKRWEDDCQKAGIKCHVVSRDGAFIQNTHQTAGINRQALEPHIPSAAD